MSTHIFDASNSRKSILALVIDLSRNNTVSVTQLGDDSFESSRILQHAPAKKRRKTGFSICTATVIAPILEQEFDLVHQNNLSSPKGGKNER